MLNAGTKLLDGEMQGLPLTLSGVRKIMTMMDWGDIGQFVTFGEVGQDQIDDASYYILVSPQNVVGNTILTNLGEMVRHICLIAFTKRGYNCGLSCVGAEHAVLSNAQCMHLVMYWKVVCLYCVTYNCNNHCLL